MAKQSVVKVCGDDWMDPATLGLPVDRIKQHFRGGKFTLDVDAILPPEADEKAAANGAKKVGNQYRERLGKATRTGLEKALAELDSNNPKGWENADKLVKALNEYVKATLKKFRSDLRHGVGDAIGVDPEELQTIGESDFKQFKMQGAADFDVEDVELSGNLLDVTGALKRSGWQYCAVAINASAARVAIDKSRISEADQKLLKSAHPSGAKTTVEGRFTRKGKKHCFEFLTADRSTLRGNEAKVAQWLTRGVDDQIQKKISFTVEFVEKFTADAKNTPAKDDKEKGKEKEKEKGPKPEAGKDAK